MKDNYNYYFKSPTISSRAHWRLVKGGGTLLSRSSSTDSNKTITQESLIQDLINLSGLAEWRADSERNVLYLFFFNFSFYF